MKRWWSGTALLILGVIAATSAYAQMAPATPAPELKKLEMFAGDWTAEGTMTAAPGAPAGKWTMTTHAEWMEGNFFLVEHDAMDLGAMGNVKEIAVMGYDPDNRVYTYRAFSSTGEAENATGTLDGDTLTWLSDEHMNGQIMKGRFTMKILSPTAYNMKFELSQDGKQWMTAMEGKATKK
jgi:hypothetical protein